MAIIIGILVLVIAFQEYRIHKLVERLLLQANVPDIFRPTPVRAPASDSEKVAPENRKKLFSLQIPS
jgi:hypothetical protein